MVLCFVALGYLINRGQAVEDIIMTVSAEFSEVTPGRPECDSIFDVNLTPDS